MLFPSAVFTHQFYSPLYFNPWFYSFCATSSPLHLLCCAQCFVYIPVSLIRSGLLSVLILFSMFWFDGFLAFVLKWIVSIHFASWLTVCVCTWVLLPHHLPHVTKCVLALLRLWPMNILFIQQDQCWCTEHFHVNKRNCINQKNYKAASTPEAVIYLKLQTHICRELFYMGLIQQNWSNTQQIISSFSTWWKNAFFFLLENLLS